MTALCVLSGTTFGGLIAVQNLANANTIATQILSISYGESEVSNGATRNAQYTAAYQQAAARGISVFVSSGDEGSASTDANKAYASHGITVSGFTSTPYNVSVGGTDFGDIAAGNEANYWNTTNTANYTSAKKYVPEIPWNDSCANSLIVDYLTGYTQNGTTSFCNSSNSFISYFRTTGSGSGGPSNCYSGTASTSGVASGTCAGQPKPSWQSVYGNPADSVRDIPDVSLFAANGIWNHYITECISDTSSAAGGTSCAGTPDTWTGIGGTSGSSPMMAGIQALINQSQGGPQGNPNYALYKLAAAEYGASGNSSCNAANGSSSSCVFNDITTSDIVVDCEPLNTGTRSKPVYTYYDCYNSGGTYGSTSTSNSSFATPAYNAGSGWDFATGLGSVNAYNLAVNWGKAFPTSNITFSATSHNFGSVVSGTSTTGSSNFGVKVTNNTTAAVTLGVSFSGSSAFSLAGNNCTNVAVGKSCELLFQYKPTTTGAQSATWQITGATSSTNYVPFDGGTLSGTGVASAAVTLATAGHNFGTQSVGTTSVVYGTVLTNSYATPATLSISTTGNTADFVTVVNNCGSTLPANGSCNLQFEFKPAVTGWSVETVGITATVNGSPVTITTGSPASTVTGVTLKGLGQ